MNKGYTEKIQGKRHFWHSNIADNMAVWDDGGRFGYNCRLIGGVGGWLRCKEYDLASGHFTRVVNLPPVTAN